MTYKPSKIEPKWQKAWGESGIFQTEEMSDKPKFYCLDMFPYPSAEGIHTGHLRGYTFSDIIAKKKKMQGFNVLHPMGWDAFGLPAENYAIKRNIHPAISTKRAIKNIKQQLISIGFGYDWQREICSCDPDYYKWTQWLFLQFYKAGLVYQKEAKVNFCPSCKTVLANEQVIKETSSLLNASPCLHSACAIEGKCERCDSLVEKKYLKQWFFKITKYADRLLNDLNKVDWPENIKIMQKNWIGRSEGTEIKFSIKNIELEINVFTSRVDTLFGCTYMVIAPEHPFVASLLKIKNQKLKTQIERKRSTACEKNTKYSLRVKNIKAVENYIYKSKNKTEIERLAEDKEKTGIELKGIKAINPVNNKEIPIFIADYVLLEYGTGAIMAVPAHDQRDFIFAQKYDLSIEQTIAINLEDYNKTLKTLNLLKKITEKCKAKGTSIWVLGGLACAFHAGSIYRAHEDLDIIAKDEKNFKEVVKILEKLGLKKIKEKKIDEGLTNYIYKGQEGIEVDIGSYKRKFGLREDDFEKKKKSLNGVEALMLSKRFITSLKRHQLENRQEEKDQLDWKFLKGKIITEDGYLMNAGQFTGLNSERAREEITKWLAKKGLAKKVVCYKLRDWLISRQRYWGTPIPIIYCSKCGDMPVLEKDLPVKLPNIKDFKPAGEGKSPLAKSEKFVNAKCPKCKGKAKRETDTLDTFVCSSWYFLRYADSKNKREFANKQKIKKWLPINLYIGGVEHAVLHLLYARFFTKSLKDLGYLDFAEPFIKLFNQGTIYYQGAKMSKSKGNVVSPDEIIERYGADTMRLYECFMGPADQAVEWSDKGIMGCYRFLQKVWKIQYRIQEQGEENSSLLPRFADARVREKTAIGRRAKALLPAALRLRNQLLHQTIKKVTEDVENFRFNTAISALMILVNEMEKQKKIHLLDFNVFILLLAPFAPHLAEELWQKLGNKKSIFFEKWPKYDPKLTKEEIITLIIQINGKVRDKIEVEADISEEKAKELAVSREKIKSWVSGKKIKKIIFISGKLINIVV